MRYIKAIVVLLLTTLSAEAAFAGESVTYYHNDLAGSPVAATDARGYIMWRASYEPYGTRRQSNADFAASADNKLGFVGQVEDIETGTVYLQARHYDPLIGRFMSTDPVGFRVENLQSFSRYLYGNNNPYGYKDPSGLTEVTITIQRTTTTTVSTTGTVQATNGTSTFSAYSLEPPQNANPSGNGAQSVQAGTYDGFVRSANTSTHGYDSVELTGLIPGNDGNNHDHIQIHRGNTAQNTLGCLLVGTGQGTDQVTGSTDALNGVMNLITTTQQADQQNNQTTTIKIVIVNPTTTNTAPTTTPSPTPTPTPNP